MPYERIVQWAAGPISILSGWLATKLVEHTSFLGNVGLGKSDVAHAITTAGTFAVAAGVTYAGHHKWLTNLPKWWSNETTASLTGPEPEPDELEEPPDDVDMEAAVEEEAAFGLELTTEGETPWDKVVHAGAPGDAPPVPTPEPAPPLQAEQPGTQSTPRRK